mmetsp:Transcript_17803/g.22411  ORF Transcript_17803/g.22411 Transcript_17803/m.22411 type:complete len:182 (-) Transcript_17803:961-1506(-)
MRVSSDLNDSQVDQFIADETEKSALRTQRKSGRPKSAYETFRDSSNFVEENRYGESRRIVEEGDVGPVASIKIRQSQNIEKLGLVATCATIFKAFVGLGILFQPYQYWLTGIMVMPFGHLGALTLSLYCARLLFICADKHGDSFTELSMMAYGPRLKLITEILIVGAQFGFCTNYIYFICS